MDNLQDESYSETFIDDEQRPLGENLEMVDEFLKQSKLVEMFRNEYEDEDEKTKWKVSCAEKEIERSLSDSGASVIKFLNFIEAAQAFKDYPQLKDKYMESFLDVVDIKYRDLSTTDMDGAIAAIIRDYSIKFTEEDAFKRFKETIGKKHTSQHRQ